MIHRVKGKHVPECLQPMFRDQIAELARTAELRVVDARPSAERWAFLKAASPPDRD
jgi:hypothetical protein